MLKRYPERFGVDKRCHPYLLLGLLVYYTFFLNTAFFSIYWHHLC